MGELHATMNISLDACCDHTQVLADDDFHSQMADLFGRVSALLFGRHTFELLREYWPKVAQSVKGTPAEVRLAHILDEKPKFVVSSQEPIAGWKAQRVEASADAIHSLKHQSDGPMLLVASPTLARTLLQWNLIDEYYVAISPMVAGRGPTFLAGLQGGRTSTLLSVNTLPSGVAILRYSFRARF
jgi:dihydrofolate reductase